jgi:hypothetical protein
MKDKNWLTLIFLALGVFACIIFYALFLFSTELLPMLTDHRFTSEWIYVFIAAFPMLLLIFIFLSGKISEISFGKDGVGVKFGSDIPPSLIESISLNENTFRDFFLKGRREELDRIVREISSRSSQPILLLIPLTGSGLSIDFRIMRQYIYKLSEIAPVKFIVFVDGSRKYLGYTTVDRFKARFPRFGIEYLLEDLANERVRNADIPFLGNFNPEWTERALERLIIGQWIPNWNPDRGPARVRVIDIGRFGATDQKVTTKSNVSNVYWLLIESNLEGIPVVDVEDRFVGIITKEKITESIVSQLLNKAKRAEENK